MKIKIKWVMLKPMAFSFGFRCSVIACDDLAMTPQCHGDHIMGLLCDCGGGFVKSDLPLDLYLGLPWDRLICSNQELRPCAS